jgi:predicted DNA-binding protein (MmcQ/YjbR family)
VPWFSCAREGRLSLIGTIRTLCLRLPEAFERETWNRPTFRVGRGNGRIFCIAQLDGSTITLKSDPDELEVLLAESDAFYVPPYVGVKGWIGVRLNPLTRELGEVSELIATSYCLVAPKPLAQAVVEPPTLDEA